VTAEESKNIDESICALQLCPIKNSLVGSNVRPILKGPTQVRRNSKNCKISLACKGCRTEWPCVARVNL
jgi:hypothetical protein